MWMSVLIQCTQATSLFSHIMVGGLDSVDCLVDLYKKKYFLKYYYIINEKMIYMYNPF